MESHLIICYLSIRLAGSVALAGGLGFASKFRRAVATVPITPHGRLLSFSLTGSIQNPTATVNVLTASGTPVGNNIAYTDTRPKVESLAGQSPAIATFAVGPSAQTTNGSVTIQAEITGTSGTGGTIAIKDPNPIANGRTTLNTTTN